MSKSCMRAKLSRPNYGDMVHDHPVAVAVYVAKPDYPYFVPQVAPMMISMPPVDVIEMLPRYLILPWMTGTTHTSAAEKSWRHGESASRMRLRKFQNSILSCNATIRNAKSPHRDQGEVRRNPRRGGATSNASIQARDQMQELPEKRESWRECGRQSPSGAAALSRGCSGD
ncbi:hypothetical protein B0H13DRAFT_1905959 [Mycena leptocephala]|nr:hypothetical protein B0H13DRAFT_1905959 [Mycena leptocephala]